MPTASAGGGRLGQPDVSPEIEPPLPGKLERTEQRLAHTRIARRACQEFVPMVVARERSLALNVVNPVPF